MRIFLKPYEIELARNLLCYRLQQLPKEPGFGLAAVKTEGGEVHYDLRGDILSFIDKLDTALLKCPRFKK